MVTDELLAQQYEMHFQPITSADSMITGIQHPFTDEMIVYPQRLAILSELGFDDPKLMSVYLISKPLHNPTLFWHQKRTLP